MSEESKNAKTKKDYSVAEYWGSTLFSVVKQVLHQAGVIDNITKSPSSELLN